MQREDRTPEHMALGAAAVGALAAIDGLMASLHRDTPAGPSIVVVVTGLFAAGLVVEAVARWREG